MDPARWRMLIQQFRYDNYRLHQLGNNSVFTITLQAGLSAIKTPYPLMQILLGVKESLVGVYFWLMDAFPRAQIRNVDTSIFLLMSCSNGV